MSKAKLIVELLHENKWISPAAGLPFFLSFSCKDEKVIQLNDDDLLECHRCDVVISSR